MSREGEVLDPVIQSLYDAAIDPARWPDALRTLAGVVDSRQAALLDTDFANGVIHREHLYNISAEDQKHYRENYAAIDPRMEFLNRRPARWFSDYQAFDETFRSDHPFYRDYFLPRGAGESLCCLFAAEGARMGTVILVRERRMPQAGEILRRRLNRLVAHLDRALRITRGFACLASEVTLARTQLDALDQPLGCIDETGRITCMNKAFERHIRSAEWVTAKNGKLHFSSSRQQVQVMRAIRECCRIAQAVYGQDSEARLTFSIGMDDGTAAFVTVVPLRAGPAQSWAGGPCALLRIDTFNARPAPQRLEQALGLTAAEARLVSMLCRGGPLASAAKQVGVSLNTAKTHLAAAFAKTGSKRQSELIALVSALPR